MLNAHKRIPSRKGKYFAEKFFTAFISFNSSDRFIIIGKNKALHFEISNDSATEVREYNMHTKIIAMLPTSSRKQFEIIEESGRITLCQIVNQLKRNKKEKGGYL